MEAKPRGIPLYLRALEAAKRRISSEHPQYSRICTALRNEQSGYKGELEVDYQISHLPNNNYTILKNLRLRGIVDFFQIDSFLVSRKIILTLESKRIRGSLTFDQDFHQLIQEVEDSELRLPDPVTQVSRHHRELTLLLNKYHFPSIPMINLVVSAHPYAILRSVGRSISDMVIPSDYVVDRILQLEQQYTQEHFSDKEVKRLAKLLNKLHTQLIPNIKGKFGLKNMDIIPGIHCPKCECLPINKIYGGWHCPRFGYKTKDAYRESLMDYYFLYGSQISNATARRFLLLEQPYEVSRILTSLRFPFEGNNKARVYQLDLPLLKAKM